MSDYDFTEIARKVAIRENILDHKLECQNVSNKGDGFTGIVRFVTIVGSNKQLNVVFKCSHRDPFAHANMALHQVYTNEIRFYEKIEPAFTKFQAEHNIKDPFDNTVKYYGCINENLNECLAMENIKCGNYDLWDRMKLMNPPHMELALQILAKFHGTSMAMKVLEPEVYSKITKGLNDFNIWANFIEKYDLYKQSGDEALSLDIFDPVTEKLYKDKLEYIGLNTKKLIDPIINYTDNYDVILQGDCWSNNVMFEYNDLNDRSIPKHVKIFDWQLMQTGSVAMDLSYFFYTTAPKASIDKLEHFLKVYHNALSLHLSAFGLNATDVYPYSVFWEHWQKMSLFGFIQALIMRKMMLLDNEDSPDFANADFVNAMHIDPEKEKIYRQQMKEIVMHFVDRNFV